MPTIEEDGDDDDDVIRICSQLIRSAANKAKGFHSFSMHFVIFLWCCHLLISKLCLTS